MKESSLQPSLDWSLKDAVVTATSDGSYLTLPPDDVPPVRPLLNASHQQASIGEIIAGQNAVIEGDAFDALQALTAAEELAAGDEAPSVPPIQLIYIDPPYNTGTVFQHYDDGLHHNVWLGMMRSRLQELRLRLADTGSIWVHLDDSEMAYARVLMDEIFGRDNFVAQIVVEINPKGRQLDRYFAACHDYLLVYAKNYDTLVLEPGVESAIDPQDFSHEDADGRYRLLPLRNTNKKFNPQTSPTLSYPLYADEESGRVALSPFPGSSEVMPVFGDLTPAVWRWSSSTAADRLNELRARRVKGRLGERVDVFQIDRLLPGRRKKLKTIWPAQEIGSSDSAKYELRRQFGSDVQFSTPKPEQLLERIMSCATQPGDWVMDVFAGSGTTGVVAARLGRHFILAEHSPDTIEQCCLPRLDHDSVPYQRYSVSPSS